MSRPENINYLTSVDALTAINGSPSPTTLVKKITQLEQHSRHFIARSPFCILATSSPEGCDASPRGDAPGFVHCLDDSTLLLPERPGNRIADSMRNVILNPELGLLFMIPGMDETLRVNGRGYITDHSPYLELLTARSKTPALAVLIDITEIYFHCPKAYVRSRLWDPEQYMARDDLPTLGRMILEQINGTPPDADLEAAVDTALAQDVRENLY